MNWSILLGGDVYIAVSVIGDETGEISRVDLVGTESQQDQRYVRTKYVWEYIYDMMLKPSCGATC